MRGRTGLSGETGTHLTIGTAMVLLLVHAVRAHAEVAYAFGSAYEDGGDGKILATPDVRPMPEALLVSVSTDFEDFALDLPGGKMYYVDSNNNTINRANLDGSSPQTIVSGLSNAAGLGLDLVNGKVYYGDTVANVIRRANLNGTSQEIVINGIEYPIDIAIDPAGGKFYWADLDNGLLRRADLNGSNAETLATGSIGTSPSNVALDLTASKVYWADALVGIRRADLNGANPETVIFASTGGVQLPMTIALDVANGKLYWSDFMSEPIRRANLDGTDMEHVYSPELGSFYLALDVANDTIYWEDGINLGGSGIRRKQLPRVETIQSNLLSAGGMAVHGGQLYYVDTDLTFVNLGAGSIHRCDFDGSNDVTLVSNLQLPYDIEIDPNAGKMYWTDVLDGIRSANLDGSNPQLVLDTDVPIGLELDLGGGKVYWVTINGDIARANLNGTGEELAITDIAPVTAIAYHPGLGKMYALKDDLGLVRANLDGSDPEDLVSAEVTGLAAALEFDTVSGKVYWSQVEPGPIQRANLDGSNVETAIDGPFQVGEFALAIQTNEEVWVDFAHDGTEIGSEPNPFNTLQEGLAAVLSDGTIFLNGASTITSSSETPTINQAVTLQAVGGPVTIGESGARAISRFGFTIGPTD